MWRPWPAPVTRAQRSEDCSDSPKARRRPADLFSPAALSHSQSSRSSSTLSLSHHRLHTPTNLPTFLHSTPVSPSALLCFSLVPFFFIHTILTTNLDHIQQLRLHSDKGPCIPGSQHCKRGQCIETREPRNKSTLSGVAEVLACACQ